TTYPSPRPLTGAGPLPSSSSPTSGRAQCHSNQSFFFAFGHSFGGVTFPQNCVQGNSRPTHVPCSRCRPKVPSRHGRAEECRRSSTEFNFSHLVRGST